MNKHIIRNAMLAAAALLAAATADARPDLQDTKQLELDAAQLTKLSIHAAAGSLIVRGAPDSNTIRITAEIWQSRANDDYKLTLTKDNKMALLVTEIESGGWFFFGNDDRIDLIVSVPAHLQLDIEDGSGSIEISDINGDVWIEDKSGSIELSKLGGALKIEDGSGSLTITNVLGDVKIDDGSGTISVRTTGGNVHIDDGSGSISIEDIAGVVRVSDGSGGISVDGAADFKLLNDGSGSVSTRNIGSVTDVD